MRDELKETIKNLPVAGLLCVNKRRTDIAADPIQGDPEINSG